MGIFGQIIRHYEPSQTEGPYKRITLIPIRFKKLVIALICLVGYLYHNVYALYFVEGKE